MPMKFLVAGGAGFIGAHMCKLLSQRGHQLVVFDSLVTGYRAAVTAGEFVQASLHDTAALERVFSSHTFDGVFILQRASPSASRCGSRWRITETMSAAL